MKYLIFLFTFITLELSASLSPLNQSIVEIKKILDSEQIQSSIQQEAIQSIEKNQNGYLIKTKNFEMNIEVLYLPMNRPGPHQFEFIFHTTKKN